MNPIALTVMGLGVMLIAFSTCLRTLLDEGVQPQPPMIRTSNKPRHMRHGAQRRIK